LFGNLVWAKPKGRVSKQVQYSTGGKMIEHDFVKVLNLNKNILCQFIEKMTDAEINNRIKNYWTIYEHIEHLTFSQNIFLERIKQFILSVGLIPKISLRERALGRLLTNSSVCNMVLNQHTIHSYRKQHTPPFKAGLLIEEDHPKIKPFGAESKTFDVKYSVKELLQRFCELRDEQIELLKNVTEDIWEKEGIHEEYKKYTFEILVRHATLHDSFHMWRMEELWIENENLIKEFG
jgi:hypothetical protein